MRGFNSDVMQWKWFGKFVGGLRVFTSLRNPVRIEKAGAWVMGVPEALDSSAHQQVALYEVSHPPHFSRWKILLFQNLALGDMCTHFLHLI